MKCSSILCDKHLGLTSYRVSALGNQRFCSEKCRDDFRSRREKALQQEERQKQFLDWLRPRSVLPKR